MTSGGRPTVPAVVLAAYGLEHHRVSPIAGGLINHSYLVVDAGERPYAVIQRLHPIFAAEVNIDIDVITAHLAEVDLDTPRLLRTTGDERWVRADKAVWRALSYVPGETVDTLSHPAQAEAAGELVGRFHRALADFQHSFAFTRAGVHDTAAHLARLSSAVVAEQKAGDELAEARELGREILDFAARLPPLGDLPRRITHGDLKISNVLFSSLDPPVARCLVDLDTLGYQTMAYELGDALRSWCNPAGEDANQPSIDLDLFAGALRGYARGAPGLLSEAEIAAIVPGVSTVCAELAARFCIDVFEDRYFGWDESRFASRRAHNLVRARSQLALGRSVRARRLEAADAARNALHV